MSGRYAEGTTVTAAASRAEIERTLERWGASEFVYGWQQGQALVMFTLRGLRIRFLLTMPDRNDPRFIRTPTGKPRTPEVALREWETGCRESWRALAVSIKAKLAAIDAGIVSIAEEFAAQIVLPGGQTVGDTLLPAIAQAYAENTPAPVLAQFGVPQLTTGQETAT